MLARATGKIKLKSWRGRAPKLAQPTGKIKLKGWREPVARAKS
jgi:hypothetical protein